MCCALGDLRSSATSRRGAYEKGFDRVYAVNVVQFWDSPVDTLRAIRRTMAPDGVIAIALQPRNGGATDEDAYLGAARIEALLARAGFQDTRVETLDLTPAVACVLGCVSRPG